VVFSGTARADIEAATNWYQRYANTRVKQHLMGAIDQAFTLLREQPLMGAPGIAGTRKWVITGFPYIVIYRVDGETLRVLAFRHQRRRPLA
jgi:addiction module RelE/StbE family toxin